MIVALYARVSTLRQENEETIGTQILAVKKFAQDNGHTIVKEYLDDGWSGTLAQRPALDALRLDAGKGVWQAVISYDPDRIARDYILQGLVVRELEAKDVQVLFVTMPPIANNQDRLLFGVKAVFADYERLNNAEKFRLGKLRRATEGKIVTSDAPYGYRYLPKGPNSVGELEIEPMEAETVKQIFEWVGKEGLSIRKVISRLQELQIPPRKSKRLVWSSSTLTRLLRNTTYIGKAFYLKSYGVEPVRPQKTTQYKRIKKTSRRSRNREDWIEIPVVSLIDKSLFQEVQRRLDQRNAFNPRNKKNQYLLGGMIQCSCGSTRAGEGPMQGKHLYYRCSDRVNKFPLKRTCFQKGVNARVADALVWDKIHALITDKELIKKQAERWFDKRLDTIGDQTGSSDAMHKELKKITDEMARYVKAFGAGLIEERDFEDVFAPLRQKRQSLENQIATLEQNKSNCDTILPQENELESFVLEFKEFINQANFSIRRKTLEKILDKIVATEKEIQVFGHLSINRNVEYESISRYRRPAQRR